MLFLQNDYSRFDSTKVQEFSYGPRGDGYKLIVTGTRTPNDDISRLPEIVDFTDRRRIHLDELPDLSIIVSTPTPYSKRMDITFSMKGTGIDVFAFPVEKLDHHAEPFSFYTLRDAQDGDALIISGRNNTPAILIEIADKDY